METNITAARDAMSSRVRTSPIYICVATGMIFARKMSTKLVQSFSKICVKVIENR